MKGVIGKNDWIGLVPVFVRKLVHMIQEAWFDKDKHLPACPDYKIAAATVIYLYIVTQGAHSRWNRISDFMKW